MEEGAGHKVVMAVVEATAESVAVVVVAMAVLTAGATVLEGGGGCGGEGVDGGAAGGSGGGEHCGPQVSGHWIRTSAPCVASRQYGARSAQ